MIRRYGFKKSEPRDTDRKYKVVHYSDTELPANCDLREWCPPVYDQGELGSCTANAGSCALQFDENIQKSEGKLNMASRLFLYYAERQMDGDIWQDGGSTLRTCIQALNIFGVCDETLWPYDQSRFTERPPQGCWEQASFHKGLNSFALSQNERELKHCLAIFKRPFVFGFQVYDSFEGPEIAQTGIMKIPGPHENCLGGHAVICVGYRDDGYFIIRNSWGTGWGDEGYFYMPKEFILDPRYCSDFWCLQSSQ